MSSVLPFPESALEDESLEHFLWLPRTSLSFRRIPIIMASRRSSDSQTQRALGPCMPGFLPEAAEDMEIEDCSFVRVGRAPKPAVGRVGPEELSKRALNLRDSPD